MKDTVIARQEGRVGRLTFARHIACHVIEDSVVHELVRALSKWALDDSIDFILLDLAPSNQAFFAARDAAYFTALGNTEESALLRNLRATHRLTHLIANYPKPYVSILDGMIWGAGMGVTLNGSHQIATDRTWLSFPESGFGWALGFGATRFLAQLSGEVGVWLAMTGSRLSGTDAISLNLASHFCKSRNVETLKASLMQNGLVALSDHQIQAHFSRANDLDEINRIFEGDCANKIKERLEAGGEWAKGLATKVGAKSPLSTKIVLRQVRTGRYLSTIKDALMLEYRIESRLISSRNYREGMRAMFCERDFYPRWRPRSLANVRYDMVSKYFSPLENRELALEQQAA